MGQRYLLEIKDVRQDEIINVTAVTGKDYTGHPVGNFPEFGHALLIYDKIIINGTPQKA